MKAFLYVMVAVALTDLGCAIAFTAIGKVPERTITSVWVNTFYLACMGVWACFILRGIP